MSCKGEEKNSIISCSLCGGGLTPVYFDSEDEAATIRRKQLHIEINEPIFETFHNLLPLQHTSRYTTLHDYFIPVLSCKNLSQKYLCSLQAKLEFLHLTSSIKDREATVEVSKAKELGYKTVVVASTGNLASSLASHCQKAGLNCRVYVPTTVSDAKLYQIKTYGATVEKKEMNYDQIVLFVRKEAEQRGYFLGGLQAFRSEGYKTVAYELYLQKPSLPQRVIVPMGDGTTFVGIWQGFRDLYRLKLTKRIPQMIGVQEKGLDPVAIRFNSSGKLDSSFHGIAKAIHIVNPLDGDLAIQAMRETKGTCLSVTTAEIRNAFQELAISEGIYTEYASAATFAAFKKLLLASSLNGITMLILTGHGLKN
jgi:threonine synthase